MHELSIVTGIIRIVEEAARRHGAVKVESIELEIGEMAGIDRHAFDFAWRQAVKGTLLEGARRMIREIPAKARCLECGHDFSVKQSFDACPRCGSYFKDIYQGKEMRVKAIEIEKLTEKTG